MAQVPITPPLQKPVQEFSTPNHRDGFFTEMVSKESARYMSAYPIKRGTLYSTLQGGDQRVSDSYTSLYFLKEIRVATSDQLVLWTFATDQMAQDVANASITYGNESLASPIYARVYTFRREVYDAAPTIAYQTALTALIAIKITAGGTGYLKTDTVNIAGALGASAELVVDVSGVITNIIVTNCGSGYDSAALPAITFTSATGAGATAVAIVQPKTALLVHQEKQELGHDSPYTAQQADSPYSSEFVRVVRIYKTFPGQVLTDSSATGELRKTLLTGTTQEGVIGTLPAETTAGVLESAFNSENSVSGTRKTSKLDTATNGLADLYFGQRFIGLPARVGGISHKVFCNGVAGFSISTEYAAFSGSAFTKRMRAATSALCKTRKTVQHVSADPKDSADPWVVTYTSGAAKAGDIRKTTGGSNPNIGGSTTSYAICTLAGSPGTWYELGPGSPGYITQQLHYDGKFINVALNNVLNDAITIAVLLLAAGPTWTPAPHVSNFGVLCTDGNGCDFYEDYNFAATSPNASDYNASSNTDGFGGRWFISSRDVEPLGAAAFRVTVEEFLAPPAGW